MLSRFHGIPERDGQTNGWTDGQRDTGGARSRGLSRIFIVSTLTRDIDIAILIVCLQSSPSRPSTLLGLRGQHSMTELRDTICKSHTSAASASHWSKSSSLNCAGRSVGRHGDSAVRHDAGIEPVVCRERSEIIRCE